MRSAWQYESIGQRVLRLLGGNPALWGGWWELRYEAISGAMESQTPSARKIKKSLTMRARGKLSALRASGCKEPFTWIDLQCIGGCRGSRSVNLKGKTTGDELLDRLSLILSLSFESLLPLPIVHHLLPSFSFVFESDPAFSALFRLRTLPLGSIVLRMDPVFVASPRAERLSSPKSPLIPPRSLTLRTTTTSMSSSSGCEST